MKRICKTCLVIALLLFGQTSAAQVCDITMSFKECSDSIDAQNGAAVGETRKKAIKGLNTVNTGSQTGSDTATEDFNPLLQASVDATGLSDDNAGKLTFSWNDFLQTFVKNQLAGDDGSVGTIGQNHKLIVSLESPEVYEPLKVAVTDDSIRNDLESSLSDFDDMSIDLRIALNSKKYGRNINNHLTTLTAIQTHSMAQVSAARGENLRLTSLRNQIVGDLINQPGSPTFDENAPLNSMFDETTALGFVKAMEDAREALIANANAYDATARRNGLFDLMNLVNNQPQFVFAAKARLRDEVAGPSEYSARLIYEFGGVNVNTYGRFQTNRCSKKKNDDNKSKEALEVECLTEFVSRNREAISSGNRFAFSAEYTRRDSYSFADFGVMLDEDKQSSFVSKLTYAQNLGFGKELFGVGSKSRIDLSASYDDVSSDPMRHDRAIANATFAQELSNGLFLTVSLEWANKPEYRVDSNEEVSVMAGISYKLPGME